MDSATRELRDRPVVNYCDDEEDGESDESFIKFSKSKGKTSNSSGSDWGASDNSGSDSGGPTSKTKRRRQRSPSPSYSEGSMEAKQRDNRRQNAKLLASFGFKKLERQAKAIEKERKKQSKKKVTELPPREKSRRIRGKSDIQDTNSISNDVEEELQEEEEIRLLDPTPLREFVDSRIVEDNSEEIFQGICDSPTWTDHQSERDLTQFVRRFLLKFKETKLFRDRVMTTFQTIEFHPTTSKALLMAGSRTGKIAFLDITEKGNQAVTIKHHKRSVSAIKAHPSQPGRITSVGRDGIVCIIDVERAELYESFSSEIGLKSMDYISANTILTGSDDGIISMIDIRRKRKANDLVLDCNVDPKIPRPVHCISVHPVKRSSLIAASTSEGNVLLWDIRNPKQWLQCLPHELASHSCEFSPVNGSHLLTSTISDEIRIYDTASMETKTEPKTVLKHKIYKFPASFWPHWFSNREDCFVVGNRAYRSVLEVFSDTGTKLISVNNQNLPQYTFSWLYHPTLHLLAGGSIHGTISYFSPESQE